jgi:hypothetical protein
MTHVKEITHPTRSAFVLCLYPALPSPPASALYSKAPIATPQVIDADSTPLYPWNPAKS